MKFQVGIKKKLSVKYPTVKNVAVSLNELTQQLEHKEKWNLALSGGYDSNLLLYCIKHQSNEKIIQLFSVGGKEIDETTIAFDIIKNYTKCELNRKKVKTTAFNLFPDLVWQLEGYLFQDGIFLQNTLAEAVGESNANNIILGEMADQLLNFLFYSKKVRLFEQSKIGSLLKIFYLFKVSKKYSIKKIFNLIKIRNFLLNQTKNKKNTDYDVMFDYILKKNGLLLNKHGIQSLYPFLKNDIHESINPDSIKNIQKNFFKKQVKNTLKSEISRKLNKNGGTTDIYYLFENHFSDMEKIILQSSIIKKVFNLKKLGEILYNREENWHFIIQLYYVATVETIFTTYKFENFINNESFNISTVDTFDIFLSKNKSA